MPPVRSFQDRCALRYVASVGWKGTTRTAQGACSTTFPATPPSQEWPRWCALVTADDNEPRVARARLLDDRP